MSVNTCNIESDINLLFQRPNEPLFTAKDDGKTAFDVPLDFYTDRYKIIGTSLRASFDNVERYVQLRSIQLPNLDFTKPIKRRGPFSLFNKNHQKIAGQLIQILMDASERDFISLSAYIKDRVNPYLFLVRREKTFDRVFRIFF